MTLLHVLTSSFHLACKQVASHRRKCFGSMLLTFLCGRHKKKFALCHSHSFKKLLLRWSCFLNAKQWVLSEICKGENCQSYKMPFTKNYLLFLLPEQQPDINRLVRWVPSLFHQTPASWDSSPSSWIPSGGLSQLVHGSLELFGWGQQGSQDQKRGVMLPAQISAP